MATFTYDAVDPQGRSVKGKIEADNEQVVLAKLHEQKFHVTGLTEARTGLKTQAAAKAQKSSSSPWSSFPASSPP